MERNLRAYEYDTDKHQLYLNHYLRHFKAIAQQPIKLFEMGVLNGGSLLLWRDYFQHGHIAGLDLNHVNIDDPTGRISIYQGDQRDLQLLDRIAAECAPDGFDIIIDDASHIGEYTKISFWHLFDKHLKRGGYYVIEDWRVAYSELWPDGANYKWSDPTQDPPRQLSQPSEHKSQSQGRSYGKAGLSLVARQMDKLGMDQITDRARMLYRKSKYKSHFPSHDYGMAGFIKQLMDELAMDQIRNPDGGPSPRRFPKFQRMEICPGQVFILKATEQDHDLVAEQLRVTSQPRDLITASVEKRAPVAAP